MLLLGLGCRTEAQRDVSRTKVPKLTNPSAACAYFFFSELAGKPLSPNLGLGARHSVIKQR